MGKNGWKGARKGGAIAAPTAMRVVMSDGEKVYLVFLNEIKCGMS